MPENRDQNPDELDQGQAIDESGLLIQLMQERAMLVSDLRAIRNPTPWWSQIASTVVVILALLIGWWMKGPAQSQLLPSQVAEATTVSTGVSVEYVLNQNTELHRSLVSGNQRLTTAVVQLSGTVALTQAALAKAVVTSQKEKAEKIPQLQRFDEWAQCPMPACPPRSCRPSWPPCFPFLKEASDEGNWIVVDGERIPVDDSWSHRLGLDGK